jgi:membrane protease subunit (stomatin/prohibitin family)
VALIDIVRWDPGREQLDANGQQPFAYRFPETNLSTLTQLIVAESQEAVLFSKGQLVGKFGSGKHTLNTENLPVLRNLFGLPFGGKNPFSAEVWFVNKLVPLTIDWSTDAMMYQDPDYQTMVPIVARGRYGLRVDDAERFLIKLVGTAAAFGARELTNHFWGALVAKTKSLLLGHMQSQRIGIKSISAYLDPLSEYLRVSMQAFWEGFGFSLTGFYITAIEIDGSSEAGRRILDAMARQSAQVIGGYTWQQSQTFDVAEKAISSTAKGNGGLLGAVMMTNMMGGSGGIGGALMQPTAMSGQGQAAVSGQVGSSGPAPGRDVFCSNCSKKFSSSVKFCPHCGDPYMPCPRCGTDNDAKARRCISCGTPMSPDLGQSQAQAQGCTRCGASLAGSTAFCPQCGKRVE